MALQRLSSNLVIHRGELLSKLLDRGFTRKVYLSDYGVTGDGSDATDALLAASKDISAMVDPIVEVFMPVGSNTCGRQELAGAKGLGYSYRPTYRTEHGNTGWFYINGRKGITIVHWGGYKLKLNDGMKHGAFDPITGEIHPSNSPFRDTDYQAYAGHVVAFKQNEHLIRYGVNVDGNATGAVWGGKWGDSGYQCASFGIWDAGNKKVEAYDDVSVNALLDNLHISIEGSTIYDLERSADYYNCTYLDGRRQNITIAGGSAIRFHGGVAMRAGRKCQGATSTYYSAPEANFDIESESGKVYDVVINDMKLVDGGLNTFLAASFINPFSRATLNRCLLRSDTSIAQIYVTGSSIRFDDCVIEGSGFDVRTKAHQTMVEFRRCIIRNHIDGIPGSFQRYTGEIGVMEDCLFDIKMNAGMSPTATLFALTAGNATMSNPSPEQGIFRYNRIQVSGNQDDVPESTQGRTYLGSIQFFQDMDLRIIAAGLTGASLVDINTDGSTVNQRGITVDTDKVVDRTQGTSVAMPSGGYMLRRTMQIAAATLAPQVSEVTTLGSNGRRFADLFMGKAGINIQASDGSKWRISVTPQGTLNVTPG